jgi:hypothetical protein
MSESVITTGAGGTAFVGPDAVALYRATVLASALRLYAKTGMKPNSAWTPTKMLAAASGITGKRYKRGQHEQAANDVKLWADTMAAALPVERT